MQTQSNLTLHQRKAADVQHAIENLAACCNPHVTLAAPSDALIFVE